jgi:Xaa-Pro dipeptidase
MNAARLRIQVDSVHGGMNVGHVYKVDEGNPITSRERPAVFNSEDGMTEWEEQRAAELREAQSKAQTLFDEIEAQGLIRAGISESRLNADIYALAEKMYGISTYWHKRIVRAGKNTLLPYAENPPDLTIGDDDILFLDLGPVFEKWEADFGRTFVLGPDPLKHKLRDDVGQAFAEGKQYFNATPAITSDALFHHACSLATKFGWEFGGPIAGHLIGQFPHERISDDKVTLYVHPKSRMPMRSLDEKGQQRHWILEIHFVDRARQIGGFYEELLTL